MFCMSCGSEIAEAATVCGKCSQPVSPVGQVPSPAMNAANAAKVIAGDTWLCPGRELSVGPALLADPQGRKGLVDLSRGQRVTG